MKNQQTVKNQQTKKSTEIRFPFTFTYYLNASGREASLLAGGDGREQQKIVGEITLAEAKRIGRSVNEQGGITEPEFDFNYGAELGYSSTNPLEVERPWGFSYHRYDAPRSFGQLWVDYLKIHTTRMKIIELASREREEAARQFLSNTDLRAILEPKWNAVRLSGEKYTHTFSGKHPVFLEAERRDAADRAARDAAAGKVRLEREADEARRENSKRQQIAEWVQKNGTPNQKERFEAKLFPINEAVEAIKQQAFSALADFSEYESITDSEVRAECDCDCACACSYEQCSVSYTTEDDMPMRAEQWEQFKKMRSLLPEAHFTVRSHRGQCDGSNCGYGLITRLSIFVKITVGEFVFNRNYAVE